MAYPSVQFVDAPTSSANLRYDFNSRDATSRTHPLGAGDLDLGVPAFTGEPGGVGFDYGYRLIRLIQRIEGGRAVALAKMSLLARELLRSTNWLRVQWEAGAPVVYFKTYRGEPGGVSLEHGDTAKAWDVTVPLVAQGFAYGPRVTIPTVQIVQGPVDLAGPTRYAMRYVLPAIEGDAPTSLRVTVTPVATLSPDGQAWLIANLAGSASMTDPVIDIGTGDGFTAGTGTAAPTADANYFDGEYRAVTIAAGTPNLLTRLSGNILGVPPGRYKVLLRCEADAASGVARTYLFQLGTGSSNPTYLKSIPVTVNSRLAGPTPDLFRGWVDLGDMRLPARLALPSDVTVSASSPTSHLALRIGTADGSAGAVRIDALKLIPLDAPTVDRATVLKTVVEGDSVSVASTTPGTWDGDTEAMWGIGSGTWMKWAPSLRGGFPVADPAAAQNLLIVMGMEQGKTSTAPTVTTLNAQMAVDISYHPRFMYLGDGT